ncbi:MAG: hypothetical protein HEEMFOPI_01827 [Holosporales bacterium]
MTDVQLNPGESPIAQENAARLESAKNFKKSLSDALSHLSVQFPKEYIPFIQSLKTIFPLRDGEIDFTRSYGDAKKILLSLKEDYLALLEDKKTRDFLQSFHGKDDFFSDVGYKLIHQYKLYLNRTGNDPLFNKVFYEPYYNPEDKIYQLFVLYSLRNFEFVYMYLKRENKTGNLSDSLIEGHRFLYTAMSQPKELIERNCPLNCHKILFPYYFLNFYLMCLYACEGIFKDFNKTYTIEGDLNDDMPFVDVLNKAVTGDYYFSSKRIIENFYLMIADPSMFEQELA